MVTNKELVTKEGRKAQKRFNCIWIPCARWVRLNKHMRGENTDSHPVLPPKSLLSPSLFVRLWVCEWEKQCCPAEPEHHSGGGGGERVLEKRRAEWHSGPCGLFLPTVCGKTLWGTQTRHSFTHRHYVTPAAQRRCRRCEEGGVKQTEQRNFSGWGGIMMEGAVVREMWAHLPLAKQCRWDCHFSNSNTMVPILKAEAEQGEKLTSATQSGLFSVIACISTSHSYRQSYHSLTILKALISQFSISI